MKPETALFRSTVRLTGVLCTDCDEVLIEPPTRLEEVVMTSRPVGQEGHCFFTVVTR